MPQASPLTLLLVNEQAEEIKLTTISLRKFFPGCRVEAVYSAEEALEWVSKQNWLAILLDEQLPCKSGLAALPELRRQAPDTVIILQAAHTERDIAAQAMQAGADSYLFKKSPAFLTELPLVMQAVLDKRDLQVKLDRSERRLRAIADMTDLLYELDTEGCFTHAGSGLLLRLGYSEQDLIGAHYSKLVHPDDRHAAGRRFNERRTGARASRKIALRLLMKPDRANQSASLEIELHATGLYSRHQQFLGTLGLAHEKTERTQERASLHLTEEELHRLQRLEALAPSIAQAADKLNPPLAAILNDTERLLKQVQDLRIEEHLQAVHGQASQAVQAASELTAIIHPGKPVDAPEATEPSADAPPVEQPRSPDRPPLHQTGVGSPAPTRQIVSQPDRRRAPRINRPIEACVSLRGSSWKGTVLNISMGGLYMVFDSTASATEGQPIQLGITSEVGILEVHGVVRGTREAVGLLVAPPDQPALGLAVEFTGLGTTEELILASLLDELREGSVGVKVTALMIPQETGDLLLEICSMESEAIQSQSVCSSPSGLEEPPTRERRLAIRVNLSIPTQIENGDAPPQALKQATFTSNISLGGACIYLQAQPNLVGQRLLLHLSTPQGQEGQDISTATETLPITVTGEIIWVAPDATMPTDFRESRSSAPLRAGIRFLHRDDEGERRIADLAGQYLISPVLVEQRTEGNRLASELIECRNERGQRIAVYHDQPRRALPPGSPLVIISPGYGETKKEYITLAYYLASNGFHVLRYDHTNHVGESDGEIQHATLSNMKRDLLALLDYAERNWPSSPVTAVATSLAGRVALKATSQDHRIRFLVLLASVVDVQATLLAVHQEDLIGTYLRGTRRGVINMLGFNIDADGWLEDASKERYGDLQTTIKDAERIGTPIVFFSAEHDAWVSLDSVKAVQAAYQPTLRKLYLIPEALHRLHENPRKARAVFRQLVTCCLERFYPLFPQGHLQEPLQREVGLQNRLERERARVQHHMAKAENVEFWRDYLEHFHYIANVADFWQLLDHIYRLAGTFEKGARILDAGCGNGNFGMFLLINQAYRQRNAFASAPETLHYVGVDFVRTALLQAQHSLANATDELCKKLVPTLMPQPLVTAAVSLADLNMPLPFRDNQFDRIVSNLVIGYLQDPLFTLRELLRVLAPHGKLVITNLKPQADLSKIYRNFLARTERAEEVEEGRQLLNNSGKIKQGESDGIFRFFDKQELTMLLLSSGAQKPRVYSTFANQAYIAVAEKPGTIYASSFSV